MATGRMTTGEKSEPGPWLPTTERSLEEAKNRSRKWSASCETRRSTSPPMSDRSLPCPIQSVFPLVVGGITVGAVRSVSCGLDARCSRSLFGFASRRDRNLILPMTERASPHVFDFKRRSARTWSMYRATSPTAFSQGHERCENVNTVRTAIQLVWVSREGSTLRPFFHP